MSGPAWRIIAAVSPDWVIGVSNEIPWHYAADLKRFKRLTLDSTIVMGRKTFESIGRPLPRRRNIVITRSRFPDVDCFRNIDEALKNTQTEDVWFIGGAGIYRAALEVANEIDLTHVPDQVALDGAIRFPSIDPTTWKAGPIMDHPEDPNLRLQQYQRIKPQLES